MKAVGTEVAFDPSGLNLTSGRLLAGNVLWNLVGQGLPMIAAVFAIPPLIRGLGTERFGVLTLAWALIGYFSLFDLGLGRALTQLLSEMLGKGESDNSPALVWTALLLMFVSGLVGSLVLGLISPMLVHRFLKIPPALQPETLAAFRLLALSIPLVISNAGLVGILAAFQRFRPINAVRVPMGLVTFLAPLITLRFSRSLSAIVLVLVLARVVGWLVYLQLCFRAMPSLRHHVGLFLPATKTLLRFGGWLTVTNLVGPLMVYLDRFLIGGLISTAAIAYYATPYEVVTKLWIVPSALVAVLLPAFTVSLAQDQGRATVLFERATKYVFFALFPIILVAVALAPEGLGLWLGREFASHGTGVLRWLALGVLVNSLANVPFVFVQSAGRPDLSAKLHAVELPLYLAALWLLIQLYGIDGAAIAWTARTVIDAAALFLIARRFLSPSEGFVRKGLLMLGVSFVILGLACLPMGLPAKALLLLLILTVCAAVTWYSVQEERRSLRGARTTA